MCTADRLIAERDEARTRLATLTAAAEQARAALRDLYREFAAEEHGLRYAARLGLVLEYSYAARPSPGGRGGGAVIFHEPVHGKRATYCDTCGTVYPCSVIREQRLAAERDILRTQLAALTAAAEAARAAVLTGNLDGAYAALTAALAPEPPQGDATGTAGHGDGSGGAGA
jgi:hypothetical protein